jgi:hypothetical protein
MTPEAAFQSFFPPPRLWPPSIIGAFVAARPPPHPIIAPLQRPTPRIAASLHIPSRKPSLPAGPSCDCSDFRHRRALPSSPSWQHTTTRTARYLSALFTRSGHQSRTKRPRGRAWQGKAAHSLDLQPAPRKPLVAEKHLLRPPAPPQRCNAPAVCTTLFLGQSSGITAYTAALIRALSAPRQKARSLLRAYCSLPHPPQSKHGTRRGAASDPHT